MPNEVGRGIFIPLTPEEDENLWAFLVENKYERTPAGLKAFLMDCVFGEPNKPEVVIDEVLLQKATALGVNFLKKKILGG